MPQTSTQTAEEDAFSNPEAAALVAALRAQFTARDAQDLVWRRDQLRAFKAMLKEEEAQFLGALEKDLRKSPLEGFLTEVGFVVDEVEHALSHLDEWARPEKASTPLHLQPGTSRVVWEPLGVALIIGAWNYPIQLTLAPLVPCLTAGNSAVLKPSEMAPACSDVLAKLIPRYLDESAVAVVQGAVPETSALLEQRFDKIFFTGSGRVGRIIMTAAAQHLTPVTLELGGKSPCVVDRSADLDVAARRIVFGKFTNAGQTCVAPDYVLAHREIYAALLDKMKAAIESSYGADPQASPDLARIVNAKHHQRLVDLLEGQEIAAGGAHDAEDLFLAPTILRNVSPEAAVMADEIFGPILPTLPVDSIEDAIQFCNERDKPLAFYLFCEDRAVSDQVINETSSGGFGINEALFHLTVPDLPFGGVGPSGMGRYHGEWGFRAFSNARAVLDHSTFLDPGLRYPPYSENEKTILRALFG